MLKETPTVATEYSPRRSDINTKEITRLCALRAGIPEGDPNHRMSASEFAVLGACVEKRIEEARVSR